MSGVERSADRVITLRVAVAREVRVPLGITGRGRWSMLPGLVASREVGA
jgi:hypothetical protein